MKSIEIQCFKSRRCEAGETAQSVRALIAIPEDLGSSQLLVTPAPAVCSMGTYINMLMKGLHRHTKNTNKFPCEVVTGMVGVLISHAASALILCTAICHNCHFASLFLVYLEVFEGGH